MADIEHAASVVDGAKPSSVGDAVRALIEDGQTLVEAELAYRKAQLAFGLDQAKAIVLWLMLGLAFAFFTLLALVVGLLLAVAHYVGVWGALAIVGGTLFALTALCLLLGLKRTGSAKAGLQAGETPR